MTQLNDFVYTRALENSIKTFDEDLARIIVLAGLSKSAVQIRRMFSLASHIQNIRAVSQESFTPADLAAIEATNVELASLYRNNQDQLN